MSESIQRENPSEEQIFQVACEISSEEAQRAYLEQVCGDDDALKQRVMTLLRVDRQQPVLNETVDQPTSSDSILSKTIGPYKILQEIGKGGMGVVYMAEQTEPVKRRAALKIVKPGLDTDQVVARFEAERQALAMMDHPNIAKVLDAGATDDGRPYFVMELVKGVPITQYCDEHRLNTRQRLELFRTVCRGVQHAHLKGIIHRDLKPSNVLVAEYDHQPVAKIIDFGVAKATNHELTEKTMFTQFGQIIGTLDYMSPEQAKFNQLDIDTRSDVYSLGVMLYELLTGETPIEKERLKDTGLEEVLRIIREDEPLRPSTRVGSSATLPATAANRNTEPAKLAGQLREDLDWIAIKAMAKEREQRYQSAEELAADVERHLQDIPICARRPSLLGRTRKFVRRKKTPVLAAVAVLTLTLVAVGFGLLAYFERVDRAQKQADLRASRLETESIKAKADRERSARASLHAIKRLAAERKNVDAFQLAVEVREALAGDADFESLWEKVAIVPEHPFDIRPEGTTISYRQSDDPDAPWTAAGQSPLSDTALPCGPLRFRFSKEGFLTREFQRGFPDFLQHDKLITLDPIQKDREGMASIYGINAADWNDLRCDLRSYHIDRYEVSNRQFQEFVDQGGYNNADYWLGMEFVDDNGKTLTWKEATDGFVDSTGQPGPATWTHGRYPEGQGDHPVGGISRFEAMAYAASVEKNLPTFDHWRWAANVEQGEQGAILTAMSNFSQRGTTPRGAHNGIGRFEVYDMAGNVREWIINEHKLQVGTVLGGCWDDIDYLFYVPDVLSPWDRNPRNGFRCVAYGPDGPEEEALARLEFHLDVEKYVLPKRETLESVVRQHRYDRDYPLEPETLQIEAETRSPLFRHEVVEVNAAYDDVRFKIHLLIPRDQQDSYETVVLFPGMGSFNRKSDPNSFPDTNHADWRKLEHLLQSGRIVCRPTYEYTLERHITTNLLARFADPQQRFQARDDWMNVFVDLRRSVDYLMTRAEVNQDRLMYYGISWGAMSGPISLVLEPRFKAGIFISGGYWKWEQDIFPELASSHFAPHVKQPVIMINGLRDYVFPIKYSQRVLFDDLPNPMNHHEALDIRHNVPGPQITPVLEPWLERVWAALEDDRSLADDYVREGEAK